MTWWGWTWCVCSTLLSLGALVEDWRTRRMLRDVERKLRSHEQRRHH